MNTFMCYILEYKHLVWYVHVAPRILYPWFFLSKIVKHERIICFVDAFNLFEKILAFIKNIISCIIYVF